MNNLKLKLQSVKPIESVCMDFDITSNELTLKEKNVKIPTVYKFTCAFTNEELDEPIVNGMIIANFDYNITRIFSQEIVLRRR